MTVTLWALIGIVTAVLSLTLGLGAMGGAHRVAYAMQAPAATVPAANHVGIMSAALYVVLAAGFVLMTTVIAWVTPRRRISGTPARTSPAGGRAGLIPAQRAPID